MILELNHDLKSKEKLLKIKVKCVKRCNKFFTRNPTIADREMEIFHFQFESITIAVTDIYNY